MPWPPKPKTTVAPRAWRPWEAAVEAVSGFLGPELAPTAASQEAAAFRAQFPDMPAEQADAWQKMILRGGGSVPAEPGSPVRAAFAGETIDREIEATEQMRDLAEDVYKKGGLLYQNTENLTERSLLENRVERPPERANRSVSRAPSFRKPLPLINEVLDRSMDRVVPEPGAVDNLSRFMGGPDARALPAGYKRKKPGTQ